MACFHPIDAWQSERGAPPVFLDNGGKQLKLPCGQCIGCRLERSRQWAVRCVHESQCHDFNSFVTLTYRDEHYLSLSLVYRDFQLFMKRLRKALSFFDVTLWQWVPRFYMCGEYGGETRRPHFHVCLFGVHFHDRQLLKVLPSGSRLYTSALLERLWPFGFSSIGDVTFESAAYVARYCMKKVTGNAAKAHYSVVDGSTGECVELVPEFNRMSLKPGIGALWYRRYHAEVYPRDEVVLGGVRMRPPRYYDRLLASGDADLKVLSDLEFGRMQRALLGAADETPERLAVREAVTRARLSLNSRSLK